MKINERPSAGMTRIHDPGSARVQGLASSRAIFVTQPVVEDPNAAKILQSQSLHPSMRRAALRGIADETTVYEIP